MAPNGDKKFKTSVFVPRSYLDRSFRLLIIFPFFVF